MAALDQFEKFNSGIPQSALLDLVSLIRAQKEDLLAARSEDARLRLMGTYLKAVHDILPRPLRKV
jgi:hypothetical protein